MTEHTKTVTLFTRSDDDFELLDERRRVSLPIDELRANLHDFLNALDELLPRGDEKTRVGLKKVSVEVGIDAKGHVGFLGTGVEVGGSATLTLEFEF